MKTYIVYVKGVEASFYIKATSHNSAEKKAQKKFPHLKPTEVSVSYTEI